MSSPPTRSAVLFERMVRVARAAMLLRAGMGPKGHELTEPQADYANLRAGAELGGALIALQEVLPGMRARAEDDPDVDAMLSELEANIRLPEGPGAGQLAALGPVAVVTNCLLVKAERGEAETDEALWRRLDECLFALEATDPGFYVALSCEVDAWFDPARIGVPPDPSG